MITIWKFPLTVVDEQTIPLAVGADILCVQIQRGEPFLWARVNRNAPLTKRRILILGTGHPADETVGARYIGTFPYMTSLVFHAFDAGEIGGPL